MKYGDGLGIAAVEMWLPPEMDTVAEAVARGALQSDDTGRLGVDALPISGVAPPQMAARAGRCALESADWPASTLDLVVHAWTYYQGHDFWSPAHYVADQVGAPNAEAFGIVQMCTGGVTGIGVAGARLLSDPQVRRALVTTADWFPEPGFRRWTSDYGIAYGDGATAVLLQRHGHGTPLRLLATATTTAAQLECTHRGNDPFGTAPRARSDVVDIQRTMKVFLESHGVDGFVQVSHQKVRQVLLCALADAEIDPQDERVRYIVLPRIGTNAIEQSYLPVVADVTSAEILTFGPTTGHLGAGDLPAGLAELLALALLRPREIAVLIGVGAGFTWSCAVAEAGP